MLLFMINRSAEQLLIHVGLSYTTVNAESELHVQWLE